MDDAATKRQLLERAAALLGRDELARRLNVPSTLLESWIRGDVSMGDGKLMDLARLLDNFARQKRA
jgi:hypothetical protein